MISCKIEVLRLVVDCCLPPLLPAIAAAAAATAPVSIAGSFTTPPLPPPAIRLLFVSKAPVERDGGHGRRRRCHQKGVPRVQRGRRQWRCEGVENNDSRRADFADIELADDAGDVAAAAVARDLARGAAITAGGEGGGVGGGGRGSAGASLRLSNSCCLTTGCVIAVANAQTSLLSMRMRLRRHRDCDCRPW